MNEASLDHFYRNEYRTLYSGSAVPSESFIEAQRRRGVRVQEFVSELIPSSGRVADIGCGAGGTLLPFREAGYDVVGCDLGPTYLEAGRELGLDLRQGDVRVIADEAPFDLVILSHVLEHVADPRSILAEIERILSPTGVVYIEVPGLLAITKQYGDPLRYFQNAHLWNFDLNALTDLAGRAGYRLLRGTEHVRAAFTPTNEAATASAPRGSDLISAALERAERVRYTAGLPRTARLRLRALIGPVRIQKIRRSVAGVQDWGRRWFRKGQ